MNIAKKSFIYLIGTISSKLLVVLLIPLYAYYVSTDDLGYFDYGQNIVNFSVPVIYIAIWEAILKFVLSSDDKETRSIYIYSSLIYVLFTTLVIILIILALLLLKVRLFSGFEYVSAMIISYGIAQVWQYYSRAMGENIIFIVSGILSALCNLILIVILAVLLDLGIQALYLSFILSNLIIVFVIELKLGILKTFNKKYVKKNILKEMLVFSFPLVLNLSALWFFLGFGKYIIVHFLGPEMNGIYAFATKVAYMIGIVGSVVNMAVIENAIISSNDKDFGASFSKSLTQLFRLFQTSIIIILPFIYLVYFFIRETDYYSSFEYIPLLLLFSITMTMSTNIGSIFQAINKTKVQFTTTITGALTTVVIIYVFISFIGIYAVLLGQLVGAFVMLYSRYKLANRYTKVQIKWPPILSLLVVFIINSYVFLELHILISLLIFIISLMILVKININELLILKNKLKKLIFVFKKV